MERVRENCILAIQSVSVEEAVEIDLVPYSEPRTLSQNAFYWKGMIEPLADAFGYEKYQMHEVLLAHYSGTEQIGDLVLPKCRSSTMTKAEMREYLDWIPRFAGEHGVVLGASQT